MTKRDTADIAENAPTWHTGDRVKIAGNPSGISLRSNVGTVVGPHPQWEGYDLVALDRPAVDWDTDEAVPEIVEAAFNLSLAEPPRSR